MLFLLLVLRIVISNKQGREDTLKIIVLIAAISAIYNIYSISLVERIHEFGFLRTIGVDAEQIQ